MFSIRSVLAFKQAAAWYTTGAKAPTAVVMLNLGGPGDQQEVEPFLRRLFSDREIIQLPFQKIAGPLIAKRRSPEVAEQYMKIGGGSPIKKWTQKQGEALVKLLDERLPETAPHKFYISFRYAQPLTEEAIAEMKKDGVKRAIAFTQYPQYSCSTTGSSLNELWRGLKAVDSLDSFDWTVIDRWHSHPSLSKAIAHNVKAAMDKLPKDELKSTVLLFSAHSLPLKVVNRGDPYPYEVGNTVQRVMEVLGNPLPYRLVWQSKVGPLPWLQPSMEKAVLGYAQQGYRNLIVVPVSFTSDHIETLFEIDQTYTELAKKCGYANFVRAESLNTGPLFIEALADTVVDHVKNKQQASAQLKLRCPECVNPQCGVTKDYFTQELQPEPRSVNVAK
eukprot:TRINITY_DN4123_c0_g1_i1.p1 TRINITY_DN4123_c0_g1~~TRINITY_DN4123_c0_g1_i1.p1  ORF type:complete len:389 (-),score=88.19 TRINITY_DN4123_c0_g1_i1:109-1275(-)